jgi:hypothetical protein
MLCSGGIPAVPQNRNLSEFHSEPFRRGEKCLEFYFVEQKIEANSPNSVLNQSAEEKTTRNFVP